jgi:tetratricopeptide (TPR) repeat protein
LGKLNYPEVLVFAYNSLGVNAYFLNRFTEEMEASSKMLKIATELEDKWLLSITLFGTSLGALLKDDYTEAKRVAALNLTLREEIGDAIGSAMTLIVLGYVAIAEEENETAIGYFLRCLKISEKTGFYYGVQTSSKYLGKVTLSMGKTTEAEKYLIQCLGITTEVGFVRDIINLLFEFARLRVAQESPENAVELLALVQQHPTSNQTRMLEGRIRDSALDLLVKLEDELTAETYKAALDRGEELALEEVIYELVGLKGGN